MFLMMEMMKSGNWQ